MRAVTSVDQLEGELAERIAEHAADGWDQDAAGQIAWEPFLDRLERYLELELPGRMDDPVIRRIQRIARQAIADTR